jgi:hypothetical protein
LEQIVDLAVNSKYVNMPHAPGTTNPPFQSDPKEEMEREVDDIGTKIG